MIGLCVLFVVFCISTFTEIPCNVYAPCICAMHSVCPYFAANGKISLPWKWEEEKKNRNIHARHLYWHETRLFFVPILTSHFLLLPFLFSLLIASLIHGMIHKFNESTFILCFSFAVNFCIVIYNLCVRNSTGQHIVNNSRNGQRYNGPICCNRRQRPVHTDADDTNCNHWRERNRRNEAIIRIEFSYNWPLATHKHKFAAIISDADNIYGIECVNGHSSAITIDTSRCSHRRRKLFQRKRQ